MIVSNTSIQYVSKAFKASSFDLYVLPSLSFIICSVYIMHQFLCNFLSMLLTLYWYICILLMQAGQNKISEEHLIDRLMSIVGHIVQRKTLKVHHKEIS